MSQLGEKRVVRVEYLMSDSVMSLGTHGGVWYVCEGDILRQNAKNVQRSSGLSVEAVGASEPNELDSVLCVGRNDEKL